MTVRTDDQPQLSSGGVSSRVAASRRAAKERVFAVVREGLFGASPRPISIGRYRLGVAIGSGGFGRIHRAHDPALARDVAVKLVRSRRRSQSADRALADEARAASSIDHPNVVRVLDAGRGTMLDERGGSTQVLFVVFELLDGVSLRQWLAAGPPPAPILRSFEAAGRGLSAVHAAGLVHCDFKPANVVITREGTVKVIDFGLALEADCHTTSSESGPAGTRSTKARQQRVRIGTERYMSPQAYRGEPLGPLDDQYSFALSLIEALAREYPFAASSGDGLQAEKSGGLAHAWLRSKQIPRGLAEALLRGTDPEPRRRFASLDDLLAAIASGSPNRRRLHFVVGATLAMGLVGSLVTSVNPSAPCDELLPSAVRLWNARQFDVAERWGEADNPLHREGGARLQRRFASAASDWTAAATERCEVVSELSKARADVHEACLMRDLAAFRAAIDAYVDGEDGALERTHEIGAMMGRVGECEPPSRSAFGVDEDPEIVTCLARARAANSAASYATAESEARDALRLSVIRGLEPRRAEASAVLAGSLVGQGRVDEGTAAFEDAYLIALSLGDDRLAANVAIALTSVEARTGGIAAARVWAGRAKSITDRIEDKAMSGSVEHVLGMIDHRAGELPQAQGHYEAAAELQRTPSARAASLSNIGLLLLDLGKPWVALPYIQLAIELDRSERGDYHPEVLAKQASLGRAFLDLGLPDAAVATLSATLERQRVALGDDHPTLAPTLVNLGVAEYERGDVSAVQEHYSAAVALLRSAGTVDPIVLATATDNSGVMSRDSGRIEEAYELHLEALSIRRSVLPDHSAGIELSHANLALTAAMLGQTDAARRYLDAISDRVLAARESTDERLAAELARAVAMRELELDGRERLVEVLARTAGRPVRRLHAELELELARHLLVAGASADAASAARNAIESFDALGNEVRAAEGNTLLRSISDRSAAPPR